MQNDIIVDEVDFAEVEICNGCHDSSAVEHIRHLCVDVEIVERGRHHIGDIGVEVAAFEFDISQAVTQ